MAHGGSRQGSGRKKGSVSKVTALRRQATKELVDAVKDEGETPLEYMLRVMRTSNDDKRRDMMAVAAAPFMHPKLAAVEHSGDQDSPVKNVLEVTWANASTASGS